MSLLKSTFPNYVQENEAFLRNDDLFTFDKNDENEQALLSLSRPVGEIVGVAWLKNIRREVVGTNKSLIMGVGGRHRSGKSLFATTCSYIIDPTFWPRMDKRIIHTPEQLMDEIKYVMKMDIHGACFVIDEGGVATPSDSYYEGWYKALNKVFQIMGFLNPIIFFCAVIRDNIGSKFRKFFNIQAKCTRKDNKKTEIKVFEITYDDIKGENWIKRPKVRICGHRYTMNNIQFGRPPKFIEKAYRQLTEPKKTDLLNSLTAEISESVHPKKREEKDLDAIIAKVRDQYTLFETTRSKKDRRIIDAEEVRMKFKLRQMEAKYVKKHVEEDINRVD